jgi:hypothetical protein
LRPRLLATGATTHHPLWYALGDPFPPARVKVLYVPVLRKGRIRDVQLHT